MVLIATTGWGQQADRQRSQAAGFDHHLVKPPEPHELLMDDPCPRCGKPQVLRQGRYGEFKSCSDYPACKPERAAKTTTGRGTRTKKPTVPAA